jgi:ATP-dependent DNA helicase RecG
MDLGSPVQFVKGIGPERASELARAGVTTVEDLLYHLPLRYEDRRRLPRIADLAPGMKVPVQGEIVAAGLRRARRLSLFEARLEDGSGRLKALWFNQPYLKDSLVRGRRVILYGAVERDPQGGRTLMMSSPEVEVVDAADAAVHAGRIVPIYEKLGPLTGKTLRRIMLRVADALPEALPDPLPDDVRRRLDVVPAREAFVRVHHPADDADLAALNAARDPGHRRLILEEFFLFQLGLAARRKARRGTRRGASFTVGEAAREAVKKVLPFPLTGAQKRVLREIADDLRSEHPMNRLVQGDVGSGKTMVALLAMVIAVENGYQAAFMAPTEILAEQHFLTMRRLLRRTSYEVEWFSSSRAGRGRREALERLAQGQVQIAVGTHALIQEKVAFRRLGLAVVDEQHRFGVLQREDLRRKGLTSDVLVMTATPIPRTLALTAYGDLDVSVVDEKPPGRTPIRTVHKGAGDRRAVVDLVRRETAAGRQAYVVYPLIADSEKLEDVRGATEMAEAWGSALPGVRVGLLHGRLKAPAKEAVMAAFAAGELQVLVATTVIEVGVDVANATVMIVEHAERFGLAQLHQLRGRVGRGPHASTCVLLSQGRLSEVARQRLDVLVQSDDGFVIAERDLGLRGPGEFFGTRQSGLPAFRAGQLLRDRAWLEEARHAAFDWFSAQPPGRLAPGPLQAFLEEGGWERRFGLARVG